MTAVRVTYRVGAGVPAAGRQPPDRRWLHRELYAIHQGLITIIGILTIAGGTL